MSSDVATKGSKGFFWAGSFIGAGADPRGNRAWTNHSFCNRADDFNDPIHLEKISTLNTFTVQDLGAIPNDSMSQDYTSDLYRINEW